MHKTNTSEAPLNLSAVMAWAHQNGANYQAYLAHINSHRAHVPPGTLYLHWLKHMTAEQLSAYELAVRRTHWRLSHPAKPALEHFDVVGQLMMGCASEGMVSLAVDDLPRLAESAVRMLADMEGIARDQVLLVPENSLYCRYARDWNWSDVALAPYRSTR